MTGVLHYDATILYGQIAVHDPDEPDAAERWTDADVARGYVWRPGHVDFGVPDCDGECRIEVGLFDDADGNPADAERGIEVPFEVGEGGVAVSTIIETVPVAVPPGAHVLRFTLLPHVDGAGDGAWRIVIAFERSGGERRRGMADD